jgi:alpha-beta hydrolase superfamily lysophospholipase
MSRMQNLAGISDLDKLAGQALSLTTHDGIKLHVERFPAAGAARASMVMIHGFSTHSGLYRHVATAFAKKAIDVTMFDCRGHGRSEGRRGYVRRFKDFQDDLHLVVERTRPPGPRIPLALLGHSQGGAVALDYVLAGRAPVDVLLLAAPWLALRMKVPAWKRVMAKVVGPIWPTLTQANGLRAEDATRHPLGLTVFKNDPLIHHVATPRWFNEVHATQAHIRAAAPTLRVPTFMALAGDDRVVSTDAALDFARAAGPIVEAQVYDGLFHELYLEPEPHRSRVIADLTSWLSGTLDRIGPRP